jgi:hypothetical protein
MDAWRRMAWAAARLAFSRSRAPLSEGRRGRPANVDAADAAPAFMQQWRNLPDALEDAPCDSKSMQRFAGIE